ncbi:MAG: hypothetical protein JSS31_09845 [Proteobacteria bacterium]|nr:hypothetical protein [Pseudomonadota bacterium]
MDRQELSEWSLELADDAFPAALAALGVLGALAADALAAAHDPPLGWHTDGLVRLLQDAIDPESGIVPWQLPHRFARGLVPQLRIRSAGQRRATALPAPAADVLAALWHDVVAGLPRPADGLARAPRIALRSAARDAARVMALAEILAQPAARAAGVFIDTSFPAEGRAEWRWPMTIATLPDDPLGQALAERESWVPSDWPIRVRTASREVPRFEILVIGAGVSDALARLLSSRLTLRCGLVMVAGLRTDSPGANEALLRALAARLSAEGVAVLDSGDSLEDFVAKVDQFGFQLTHNLTLDQALKQVFGDGALLLADPVLLARARVDTSITQATRRLRGMAAGTRLRLSEKSLHLLRPEEVPMAPAAAVAPAELAGAIEVARSRYQFAHESGEATAVAELNQRLGEAERAAQRQAAVPRFVQQQSFRKLKGRFVPERAAYVVGVPVLVRIHIGPKRADRVAAPTAFPEDRLPRSRAGHRLQVVLHEPQQFDRPLLREIHLPRTGDSSAARFVFTPRAPGSFEARLSVLHRGRVLQTVLLKTQVLAAGATHPGKAPGITLEDETQVRRDWSDLGGRRQFDLALVLNHTAAGAPLATGVAGGRAWARSLEGIEVPVRKINDLLSAVALSVADYEEGLDQGENPRLLNKLARVGANLYSLLYRDQLRSLASEGFDVGDASVSHVQVVSARPDAVVPLEFMYDYNAPDPDATVCPQHRQALADGRCPAHCARTANPRAHVCPMGFWGLKKVIERHLFDPRASLPEGAQVALQAEASADRDRLDLSRGALLGHSSEVQTSQVQPLVQALKAGFGAAPALAGNWDEWRKLVTERQPALLVAFPHNEGREEDVLLEIGGKKLYTLDLPEDYVRTADGPAPLVLLLGCDVAGTAQDFSSHVRFFRQAGAAVVVSTIATVFGAHAVRVGELILAALMDHDEKTTPYLGELIRDAKRAALLESVPMALCVVAFGDADWRL